ncbi:MAG: hypothetical protein KGZ80_01025 [Methylomonas sp.]|nr:hypothetical protein [Methylomonas sp.]PPD19419.1 MAG: hypothetical protein CTY23_11875 [Methylomonas sp.]PPD25336.1 MAG: hypothetical protein CTY22_09125 [Methylomonas sp.]PPD35301.1 MAG: hypothetical protein CTY21_09125 [Methylomonas sp.]PPD51425.1 MAG: hypothetical protein CTY11_12165 [Methylomonas sp.]
MKHYFKPIALAFTAGLTIAAPFSVSAFVIDDFSASQRVTDRGNTPGASSSILSNLTGTELGNASRTLVAEATGGKMANTTRIEIKEGGLMLSNSAGSSGRVILDWHFDAIDFNRFGNALTLRVNSIENRPLDPSVTAEIIINGASRSGVKAISHGAGDLSFHLADFSDRIAMTTASNLRLDLGGPLGWDARFGTLAFASTVHPDMAPASVPLPPAFYTMAAALLGFVGLSRRKQGSFAGS